MLFFSFQNLSLAKAGRRGRKFPEYRGSTPIIDIHSLQLSNQSFQTIFGTSTCDKDWAGTRAYITVTVYDPWGNTTSFGVDAYLLPFSRGDVANVYGKHFGSVIDVDKIRLSHIGAGKSSGWAPDELRFYSRATVCSMFLVS